MSLDMFGVLRAHPPDISKLLQISRFAPDTSAKSRAHGSANGDRRGPHLMDPRAVVDPERVEDAVGGGGEPGGISTVETGLLVIIDEGGGRRDTRARQPGAAAVN